MYLFFSGKPGHNAVKVQTEEKQKQEKDKKQCFHEDTSSHSKKSALIEELR